MTIDSKLEKADDIIEQFWTGKGMNVKAGQNVGEFAWYTLQSKETIFRDALVRTLSDQGFWSDGMNQLEEASFMSCKTNRDETTKTPTLHELELTMRYTGGTGKKTPYGRYETRVGAEFSRNADGTYNLKLFPKMRAADGRSMRLVASQNPEMAEDFKQVSEQLSKDFGLMYDLLQQMGYLAKEE